ncbi:hypothetical protein DRO42_04515, partial [Candidatus Bathyarchaeota archaeon]
MYHRHLPPVPLPVRHGPDDGRPKHGPRLPPAHPVLHAASGPGDGLRSRRDTLPASPGQGSRVRGEAKEGCGVKVPTVCIYCGTGCLLHLKVREGRVVGVLPHEGGAGEGRLCIKGWSAHEFIHHPDRLKRPLVRRGGDLREASWREALSLVAEGLGRAKAEHGSDAVAVLSSAKATNEENYLLQKFARAVVGTNNIDHCARLCHASTVTGLIASFGSGTMTNSLEDVEDADAIFIIGSNTSEQHPLIARRIIRAVKSGSRLIVADPRAIDLTAYADVHLRHRPGTDVALLNAMMNVIIAEGLESLGP